MLVEGGGEQGSRGSALEGLLRQVLPAGRAGSMLRAKVRTLLDRATEGGDLTLRGWLAHELAGLLAAGSRGPSVIIVDDAHQASPLLLETLAAIVREASSRGSGGEAGRFPGLVVSYRSESPFHALVAPLVEALRRASAPAGGGVPVDCQLELSQLPVEAVQDWVDLVLPEDPGTRDRIQYALDLHRRPFALHEAMRGDGARRAAVPALSGDLEAVHASYLASLGKREREVVEVLAVLGRPAGADLLAGVLGARGQDLAPSIESLLRAGALVEASGILSLRHASFGAWLLQSLEQEIPADASGGNRRSSIHRRIALWLERTRAEPLHEVAFHWLRSPTPRRALLAARTAARRLAAAGEDRRALEFYAAIISILPAKGGSKARAIRGEAAEAYSRVGEHGRGVEILESLLPVAAERREAAVIHGRLGILCHRAGDVGRAVSHLEEGMVLLEGLPGGAARQDRLRFASELAEISGKRGDYARAEELCADALGEIQKRRSGRPAREVRHVEMVLLETLAHVKLRRFQHEEARRLFERSLAISGELGANAERGLILNNLAVLHNQQNRFAEAIACYQEAERLSASRGGDVSLVNVHSNLAHLYAKIGQPEAADEAIQRAAYHDERSGSKRTRFLRLHCTALVDLCFGRFEKAAEAFAEASALAEQLEDVFLASFDLVYLGECQVFRGEFEAAEGALARALSLGGPAAVHVAAMVRARRAVLLALRGKPKDARAACFDGAESSSIPFVDAWNDVFLGWACRLVGSPQEASRRLERARAFFARVGVPQGEIHAELELAALETDTGDLAGAEKRLRALRGRHAVGRGALKSSMLSARLLAYQARILLDGGRGEVEEASALVSEAEGYLVGRRLRDLEGMLRDLRRRLESLLPQGANGGLQDAATERPPLMAGEADLLEGRGAAAGADRIRPPGEAASVNGLGPLLDQLAREVDTALPGAGGSGVRAALDALRSHWSAGASKASESERRNSVGVAAIRGQSPAIRSVIIQVRDLAPLDHSVLITGETGTGKELVARALHGEGPRRGGPFVSVNCAALPDELLEAELFGYVKGAFSSAERDHPGLLLGSAGGTILFDEVGEMPLRTQGKLLRALERGSVRPLGGLAEVKTDVRYLFSSNRDLRMLVSEGKFRSDLFFRLGAFEIRLPPLRERREDLPALVDHIRRQAGAARPLFEESALQALADSSWPGNVRELENVVKRLVLTNAERVSGQDVRAVLGRASVEGIFPEVILRSRPLDELRAQLEREYMRQLHRDRGGSLKAMAQALGISVKALYKRMRVLGIRPRDLEPPGRGS
jgi:DNA-binding NtrC family response regulator/tetratricopeptide (TPR) repeat protein